MMRQKMQVFGSIVFAAVLLTYGCAMQEQPTPQQSAQAQRQADGVAIPPDSPLAQIRLGMGAAEVFNLLGHPTDQESSITAKAFIPFYFGGDQTVTTMHYKGLGRIYVSGGSPFGGGGRVIKIEYDPNESGFRGSAGIQNVNVNQSTFTPVSFATEIRTPDEQAIARTLEAIVTAYNNYDAENVVAHYAPEAQIESTQAQGVVTRDVYRDALRTYFLRDKNARLSYNQAKITLLSLDRSQVDMKSSETSALGTTRRGLRLDLLKRNGQWIVMESRYYGRPE